MFKHKYSHLIGDRQFYRHTLAIALPIMVQNAVTNFVSLLDNLMVGQCGLEQISGVSIISQLMFVFYVTTFGATSGPGLFCAQFYGARDGERLRSAFRFKLAAALFVCLAGLLVLKLWQEPIITLYLNDTGEGGDPIQMLACAKQYLAIMLWGLPAFAVGQTYSSTLREVGRTRVPMCASCVAVAINLTGNWLLIFGKLGFPELGIVGAALATVLSRYIEMLIVVIWSHRHPRRILFTQRVFRDLRLHYQLDRTIAAKSFPLLCNELLWSVGQAFLLQLFSLRGLNVVAALNIAYVFLDLCDVICFSMGNSIGIMVGQLLGAGKLEEAVDTDHKLIAFTMALSLVIMVLMGVSASFFPLFYQVPPAVQSLASSFILVCACVMPINILPHTFYFTLRSGGKTMITFLFDSFFSWTINIPLVYVLAHFTAMPVVSLYLCSNLTSIIKCAIGWMLVKKRLWVVNMAEKKLIS